MPIEHRAPTDTTKKQILAASGNCCAFPGCSGTIVDRLHGVLIGKIAHIKARREGGARFDLKQTEGENRSAANLMALCGKHHDIIDQRKDLYPALNLIEMKKAHEDSVENSADRTWIRPPSSYSGKVAELGYITVHYWIDRTGRARIYSDRQLAISNTVFSIFCDICHLCDLYKMAEDNPNSPARSLMQSHTILDKEKVALGDTPWSAVAHILCQMAEIPEISLGELVTYNIAGGDATGLFIERAAVFEEKVRRITEASPRG